MKFTIVVLGWLVLTASLTAPAATWYVATNSASDGPGTAWSNAFHTIQGGVDAALSNDTVLVTNGIYDSGMAVTPGFNCMNRVVITKDIVARSVNGPEQTFIIGAPATDRFTG